MSELAPCTAGCGFLTRVGLCASCRDWQRVQDAALGRLWRGISADDVDAFIQHINDDVARTSPYVEIMAALRQMAAELDRAYPADGGSDG